METKGKMMGISVLFALLGALISTLVLLLGASILVSRGIIPEDKMQLVVFLVLGLSAFVGGRMLRSHAVLAPIVAGLLPALVFFAILLGTAMLLGAVSHMLDTLPSLGALALGGLISALLGAKKAHPKAKRP